ncbi:MAG: hypothetical protein UX68_C0014G0012 [Parcubacteria group bacterium GW2011_GWA2_46_9]|nr:MAG: hypothetical protein UX68_C0014G0012 [Parcubacteria group bacterium GW2011_GWA2_46_9]
MRNGRDDEKTTAKTHDTWPAYLSRTSAAAIQEEAVRAEMMRQYDRDDFAD